MPQEITQPRLAAAAKDGAAEGAHYVIFKGTSIMEKINYINIQHLDSLYLEIKNSSKKENDKLLNLVKPKNEKKKFEWLKFINISSKIVSLIAGLGLITILILILLDIKRIGRLDIGNLLTIISVTFVGGIFSIGGVNLVNLQTALKKQKLDYLKLQKSLPKNLNPKFISSNKVHRAWSHFFVPEQNILLVYGHEHPAKIYKSDESLKQFKCIWEYEKDVKEKVHFAQAGNYFSDKYFALGDYSTGVITIYSIKSGTSYSFKSINGRVDFIEFSPEGKFLAIASGNNNIHQICVHNLETRENLMLAGFGPVLWSAEDTLFFVKDSKQISKWNAHNLQVDNVIEDEQINKFSLNQRFLIYNSQSYDKKSVVKCLDFKLSEIFDIYSDDVSIESIELAEEKIIITTLWSSAKNPNQLLVIDICGNEIRKLFYHSGYGQGYKKYSTFKNDDKEYLATVGQNLYIPIFENYKNENKTLIDTRNMTGIERLGKHFVSVHFNRKDETIFLSALNENGIIIILSLDNKNST